MPPSDEGFAESVVVEPVYRLGVGSVPFVDAEVLDVRMRYLFSGVLLLVVDFFASTSLSLASLEAPLPASVDDRLEYRLVYGDAVAEVELGVLVVDAGGSRLMLRYVPPE